MILYPYIATIKTLNHANITGSLYVFKAFLANIYQKIFLFIIMFTMSFAHPAEGRLVSFVIIRIWGRWNEFCSTQKKDPFTKVIEREGGLYQCYLSKQPYNNSRAYKLATLERKFSALCILLNIWHCFLHCLLLRFEHVVFQKKLGVFCRFLCWLNPFFGFWNRQSKLRAFFIKTENFVSFPKAYVQHWIRGYIPWKLTINLNGSIRWSTVIFTFRGYSLGRSNTKNLLSKYHLAIE